MNDVDNIEVILFDFDEVLTYGGEKYYLPISVLREVFDRHELNFHNMKGGLYIKNTDWIGELAAWGVNVNDKQRVDRLSGLMFEYFKDKINLFAWVHEIIPWLAEIKRLAILSNNSRQSILYYLGGLIKYFCCIKTYEDCWPHLKPSPNGIKLICQELNIKPSRCFMLGDSKEDILAAEEAGTPFGLVNWGKQIKSQRKTLAKLYKKNLFPDLVTKEFNNPHQLIPFFKGQV